MSLLSSSPAESVVEPGRRRIEITGLVCDTYGFSVVKRRNLEGIDDLGQASNGEAEMRLAIAEVASERYGNDSCDRGDLNRTRNLEPRN